MTQESNDTQPTPTSPATWESLGLSSEMLELIRVSGFAHTTPVQAQAIPLALDGKDILASAQTGTGKTLSFVAPMVERFAGRKGTMGLILCPTREIAQQTYQHLKTFGEPRGIQSAVLIGGIDIKNDFEALRTYPHILVATPGRLCDHLENGNLWLDFIEMVVLDEADRMLDMGFSDQLNRIMREVPNNAQKLLFSATIPPAVDRIATKFMYEPVRVCIGRPVSTTATVKQRFVYVREEYKLRALLEILDQEPGSLIVFVRSKDTASRLWLRLHSEGVLDAAAIHSNMLQRYREQALADFKSGKHRILIATDVAGRGIHVDNVAHVVNFELPMEMEEYVHRIGRTGRAQASGVATTFISARDRRDLHALEKIIGHPIEVEGMPSASEERHSDRDSRHRRPHSRRPSGGGKKGGSRR